MSQKVFYAWQSDRHNEVCRYFIRKALQKAIKIIIKENVNAIGIQEPDRPDTPELDFDRKGISGTVDITEEIEKKIRRTAVFVGDVTPVVEYDTDDPAERRKKKTPNANVMYELGYAFRSISKYRIVLVMNTAYGSPDDLPFDLKRNSHPAKYHLLPDTDPVEKAKQLEQLSKTLAEYIKDCLRHYIESVTLKGLEKAKVVRDQAIEAITDKRIEIEKEYFNERWRDTTGGPAVAITIAPVVPIKSQVPEKYFKWMNEFNPLHCTLTPRVEILSKSVMFRSVLHDGKGKIIKTYSLTDISDDGFVYSLYDYAIKEEYKSMLMFNPHMKEPNSVRLGDSCFEIVAAVSKYLNALRKMGASSEMLFGLTILRCKDLYLYGSIASYHKGTHRPVEKDHFQTKLYSVKPDQTVDLKSVAKFIKPAFLELWRQTGLVADPQCYEEGVAECKYSFEK